MIFVGCSAADRRGFAFQALGSAVDRRAYFLLLRQKKVAKEKATPTSAVGCADCPVLLEPGGGLRNSPLFPPASALLGAADGDPKPIQAPLLRSTPKIGQKSNSVALRSVLKLPSAASSSAGRPGSKGEDCLRGAAPSSAAPRGDRAAQRTRRSRATQRARPFFAYFLSARRKKVMSRVRREKQHFRTTKPPASPIPPPDYSESGKTPSPDWHCGTSQ